MMIILVAVLLGALIWSLKNWLARYISCMALLWYISEKGIPLPSDEGMKAGTRYAVEHMLKDFSRDKR